MIEYEPKPREQLLKAPQGTYAFLEENDGFEAGDLSSNGKPFLVIAKEKVCNDYGCTCMDFVLERMISVDTQVELGGHITDQDEIVNLRRVTCKISPAGMVTDESEEDMDIDEAMQEVRDALSVLKNATQVRALLPQIED